MLTQRVEDTTDNATSKLEVVEQKDTLGKQSNLFTQIIFDSGVFASSCIKINCCVAVGGGPELVVGTNVGVYAVERQSKGSRIKPKQLLDVKSVTQVDVLEQYNILLFVSDSKLYSYSLEALEHENNLPASTKRDRKICSTSFFKFGPIDERDLICCVKNNWLHSTVRLYHLVRTQLATKDVAEGSRISLSLYKEFYIPFRTFSIHFLRRQLCLGCASGFQLLLLDTLMYQPLLDPADTSLDFVVQRKDVKPLQIIRIEPDFLLCYSDFSFFIDTNGRRVENDCKIEWNGNPQAFAVLSPFIVAFAQSRIEVRRISTGALVFVQLAKNVRMLYSSTREILYAYEGDTGKSIVASLDLGKGNASAISFHSPIGE